MKPLEFAKYITGADYLIEGHAREQAILAEHTGIPQHNLPLDAGLGPAAEIFALRIKEVIVYPALILGRLTGIDAARRMIAHHRESVE